MPKNNIKVLVAEDDKFLVKAFAVKLAKDGFDVIVAGNGNEAIAEAKKNKPDIILLDLIMPQKNGFDALYELKQDEETKDIPVIITSNLSQEIDIKRGKDLGADDYLVKSDTPIQEIIAKIKQVLAKRKK
ncbi:MAG: Sensory transduction protein regX3 [Parcubacteria group bacterium ADurb.Bin316]|nr:MAG: Sensory transduction protein regX3 [Parcubacteria group bacterium ADurb.Bin316]HOZ55746.1 response regulator [bacterium]